MSNVFVATANIEKFRELISKENDPGRKALLKDLLTHEQEKLAAALIASSQSETVEKD